MKNKWELTVRQEEILSLMAEHALTSKEVAHRLGLSFKTVDVHVDRAIDRMQARSRTHALLMWDRARREAEDAEKQQRDDLAWSRARQGMVHCGTCGGFGFVKAAA